MLAIPQKVLIHRLGSLGDTAIMMPIFHHLNSIWPDAEKRVMTNFQVAAAAPPLQAVLGDDIFVDGYFAHPIGTRNPNALFSLAAEVRRRGPDIAIYANEARTLPGTLRHGAFLRLCGARRVLGLPFTKSRREHILDPAIGLYERETSRIARALEELGPIDIASAAQWTRQPSPCSAVMRSREFGFPLATGTGYSIRASDGPAAIPASNGTRAMKRLSRRYRPIRCSKPARASCMRIEE